MDPNTTLEKIRKLISLAGNNPSEEEANSAMMKAQELALSAGLEFDSISIQETIEDVEFLYGDISTKKIKRYHMMIGGIVCDNFRCKFLIVPCRNGKDRYTILGYPKDTAIVKNLLPWIWDYYISSWNSFYYKEYKPSHPFMERRDVSPLKNTFLKGFVSGLKNMFTKNVEEKGLMVIVPEAVINKAKSLKSFSFSLVVSADSEAYEAGVDSGMNAQKDTFIA